jgi:pimeloyl-ACP methyl ester carboxylesterase
VTQFLTLPGVRLRLEEQGQEQGPCFVLVHGFGGDVRSWDRLLPHLGGARHLLRYDLRGFGESRAETDEAFTHGQDLAAVLATKSIARCDLAGVSMGGGAALSFALDHPEIVRSLTLISPQISGWDWSEDWRAQWREITTLARAGRMAAAKTLWWQHPLFASVRATPAGTELRREIEEFAGQQWIRDNHAAVMPDVERLHGLQMPCLLLTGEQDVDEFRLMADVIAASAPHVRRVDVAHAGHMLHLEVPALCAREIHEFLARVAAV